MAKLLVDGILVSCVCPLDSGISLEDATHRYPTVVELGIKTLD